MSDAASAALERAFRHAVDYLARLGETPVAPTASLAEVRARLSKPLNAQSLAPEQVINDLVADSTGAIVGSTGGRFYAWVIGGALPAALAADWLTSVWDQNAGLYASGPAAAVAEETAGVWIKDLLHIPAESSFALVTGCQMAHVTCLAAARHGVLAAKGWDVEDQGLAGSPPIRIISGADRHGSTTRALRLLGLGRKNVEDLPVNEPAALENALRREPNRPTIVLLQAGELNTGAFDSFTDLVPVAKRHNAWVHVDGAFGLWAAASPRFRHLTEGAHLADSWATDGHKWLNTPYDCGYAFVRDCDAHHASLSHRESYLIHDTEARDQIDWNPEWSRRARGFATYAALRQLGRDGIADLVNQCCDSAKALTIGIGSLKGVEIVREPIINQGLVRFLDPAGVNHDARTDGAIVKILASGEAFFGGTNWRGKRCMRISVSNWRTNPAEVERVIRAVERIL